MHHLLAFFASVAASQANSQLSAVADDYFTRSAGNFQIPKRHWLYQMYLSGIGLTGGRINTASLRLRGFPRIYPYERSIAPPNDPNTHDLRMSPLVLRAEEDLRLEVDTDATAGPNNTHGLVWISDRMERMVLTALDDLRWYRMTSSIVSTANSWGALATLVFSDQLESGRYGIYGMEVVNSAAVPVQVPLAARLVLQDQYFRPGCLADSAFGRRGPQSQFNGMGLWGYFNTYQAPQIQLLANNSVAAETYDVNLLIAKAA